jgi:signal transduction histidine kinase
VPADLISIVREVVGSFAASTPAAQIADSPDSVLADVDVAGIRTVLRNLLDNAIKYSLPDSGPVTVAIDARTDVTIRVTDDGPGIPEADRATLFEPFFRVDRSRSKKTGGSGLGLSIAKRIVEAHGGTIVAESNPGRGVSFVVTLPRTG